MSLTITRRHGERLILQTASDCATISCAEDTRVRVDAARTVLVLREEAARKCEMCERWTHLVGHCVWCDEVDVCHHCGLEADWRCGHCGADHP